MLQFRTLVAVLASLLLGMPLFAAGQGNAPADAMSQDQLDGLLAPIALYPDELLTQVLMASTYPLEVVEAARFVKANPSLRGPALDDALRDKTWDPSVQSLVPFPQVLDMMNEKLEWTQRLGDAFLADEASVMRTVQALRMRAQQAGNLQSTEQQRVYAQDQAIVIEPAQPQYVYVPVYNPTVIYGPWWAPAYLPWYWYPPPIWGYPPRPPGWGYARGFYWGTAWAVNRNYWGWARPNWRGNNINININNNNYWGSRPGYRDRYPNGTGNWSHAPEHRKGVAYRDAATYNKYRPTNSTGVETRGNYRGNPGGQYYRPGTPAGNPPATRPTNPGVGQPGAFPTNPAVGQPGAFPANPSTGQPGARPANPSVGQPGTRPANQGLGQPGTFPTNPSAGQPGTRPTNPAPGQPSTRPTTPASDRPTSRPMPSQPPSGSAQTFQTQSRPQVQAESNRGQASRQNMNQQTGPGNAGGGGPQQGQREVAMSAPVRLLRQPTMTRASMRATALGMTLWCLSCAAALAQTPPTAQGTTPAPAATTPTAKGNAVPAARPRIVQRAFASPDDAGRALIEALDSDDNRAIFAVLGRGSGRLFRSGDPVEDEGTRSAIAAAYKVRVKYELRGDATATMLVGDNDYPFPYPLVKTTAGWQFDAKTGAEEIVNRRIGGNEIAAINVCLAYVDAQREYALRDRNNNGLLEYAQQLASTPGTRDGLYWETKEGEPPSPFGPLLAQARKQGYLKGESEPYYGYYYKILTAQGKDAAGGAYGYIVDGKMIGGFALVAYPGRWGASGVMTFVCNHDGVVFEKNLGRDTATIAAKMTVYNPDGTWKKSDQQ